VITFEREVVVRAGQVSDVDVALSKAPPPKIVTLPPPPAPEPPAAAPVSGPTGHPQALSIFDVLEKEFVGRQALRESLLSCSGDTRATMLQLNDPSPERTYLDADSVYYVLGGEGTLHINGRDSRIDTNGFLSVPRGTRHSFTRRGSRPLVLLAVRSGEPCTEAR
jgi:mannose-6-phosphate isomerase-like protein (cupin superfamily)